jgi:adenosylcobinamide-phosphate guanylyltransferase
MIALVMAGGRGSRMKTRKEKLLIRYKKPVILHVVDALRESGCFSKIIAATSPNSPGTNDLLTKYGVEIIKTAGHGYVTDLRFALTKLNEPTLVVSGDLPLLDAQIIMQIVSAYKKNSIWQSFLVTKELMDTLGSNCEFLTNFDGKTCCYAGVSIVNPKKITAKVRETLVILDDKRIALNLNTKNERDLIKNA